MRSWYEDRLEDQDAFVAWEHVQRRFFRWVSLPVDVDVWRKDGGESEGQAMVVSKEHVARQVREVIIWREEWLAQERLPMNTLMNDKQKIRS